MIIQKDIADIQLGDFVCGLQTTFTDEYLYQVTERAVITNNHEVIDSPLSYDDKMDANRHTEVNSFVWLKLTPVIQEGQSRPIININKPLWLSVATGILTQRDIRPTANVQSDANGYLTTVVPVELSVWTGNIFNPTPVLNTKGLPVNTVSILSLIEQINAKFDTAPDETDRLLDYLTSELGTMERWTRAINNASGVRLVGTVYVYRNTAVLKSIGDGHRFLLTIQTEERVVVEPIARLSLKDRSVRFNARIVNIHIEVNDMKYNPILDDFDGIDETAVTILTRLLKLITD